MLTRKDLIDTFQAWRSGITGNFSEYGVIGAKDYDDLINMILDKADVLDSSPRRMGDFSIMAQQVDELMDLLAEKKSLRTRLSEVEDRINTIISNGNPLELGEGVRVTRDVVANEIEDDPQLAAELVAKREQARVAVGDYLKTHRAFTLSEIQADLSDYTKHQVSAILTQFRKRGDIVIDVQDGIKLVTVVQEVA